MICSCRCQWYVCLRRALWGKFDLLSVFVVDLLRVVGPVGYLCSAHGTLKDVVASRTAESAAESARVEGCARPVTRSQTYRVNLETTGPTRFLGNILLNQASKRSFSQGVGAIICYYLPLAADRGEALQPGALRPTPAEGRLLRSERGDVLRRDVSHAVLVQHPSRNGHPHLSGHQALGALGGFRPPSIRGGLQLQPGLGVLQACCRG